MTARSVVIDGTHSALLPLLSQSATCAALFVLMAWWIMMVSVYCLVRKLSSIAAQTSSLSMVSAIVNALAKQANSTSYASVFVPWTCISAGTRSVSRQISNAHNMSQTKQWHLTPLPKDTSARITMALD